MEHFTDEVARTIAFLRWALFAMVGGGVGYVLRSPAINLRDFIIESVGAGFVGAIVAMACQANELSAPVTGVLVGVSALTGARAVLRLLQNAVLNRLKLSNPDSQAQEEDNGKAP